MPFWKALKFQMVHGPWTIWNLTGLEFDRATVRPALLFRSETFIDGFYKHVRGPATGGGTVQRVVIPCGFGAFDLFHGHAFFDHVLDAIANDGHHIAVLDHICF